MKPAGLLLPLLLAATPLLLRAEDPAAVAAPLAIDKPSPEVKQQLAATVPKYAPVAPVEAKPANAPNPDVLELPKYTVRQRPRPRLNEGTILGPEAFNAKLAKERTSSFDRNFLNKYNWLGGASASERAREEYDRDKRAELRTDVLQLAKTAEVTDPEGAKTLRDAINKP